LALFFLAGLSLPGDARAAVSSGIDGEWVTQGHTALVSIGRCGANYCGEVEKILVRKPPIPTKDGNNPNPALRNRPLVGIKLLTGFSPAGGKWTGGRIYDPETGKSYRSVLRLNPDGSLKVSGCIAFFCQSQRWTRSH
jgi:uncharacterized protein (DUF2147 family)